MSDNNVNVPLELTKALSCDKCKNEVFVPGFLIRRASKLLTGTAQDALIPINVFSCAKCGHVNDRFMPKTQPSAGAPSIEDVSPRIPRPTIQ